MSASGRLGVGDRICKFEKTEFMGFAEKKVELFKLVTEADEEMTGKLIEFAKQLKGEQSRFSDDELEKFHKTRQKYSSPSDKTILLEDAHAYIRSIKQK